MSPELRDLLNALDSLYIGIPSTTATLWPWDDPRWDLIAVSRKRQHRMAVLDMVREAVEQDYQDEIKSVVEQGIAYPVAAQTLGVSLGTLKALLDVP